MIDARVVPGHAARRQRRRREAAEPGRRRARSAASTSTSNSGVSAPSTGMAKATIASTWWRDGAARPMVATRTMPSSRMGRPIGHGQSKRDGALTKLSPTPGGKSPARNSSSRRSW